MSNGEFAEAEEVLVRALPKPSEREIVLQQLLRSVEVADSIAPTAWAVTLLSDGFRLNVGQVEVLVLRGNSLRINLSGKAGAGALAGEYFQDVNYQSQPRPHCAFVGEIDQFEKIEPFIRFAHHRFVERAASKMSGAAREGTPFRGSHCEELVHYARSIHPSVCVKSSTADRWWANEEVIDEAKLVEGARLTVQVNSFERNLAARRRCLAYYGTHCIVCDFSFESVYGDVAVDYIHVHHLHPLASIGEAYIIDPVSDLRPVCANCHAVIHLRKPPFTIDDVKAMLRERSVDAK